MAEFTCLICILLMMWMCKGRVIVTVTMAEQHGFDIATHDPGTYRVIGDRPALASGYIDVWLV